MAEITLDTSEHDIGDLIRYLEGDHHMGVYDRQRLVEAIRSQLPEPEPRWVNGDVIAAGGTVWMRSGDAWRSADRNSWASGRLITNYWEAKKVEILYKHRP